MAVAVSNIDGEHAVLAEGDSNKPETRTELLVTAISFGVVIVCAAAGAYCAAKSSLHIGEAPALRSGISAFALLYVAAQAIERILVPIAPLVSVTTPPADKPKPAPGSNPTQASAITVSTAKKAAEIWATVCDTPTAARGVASDALASTARDEAKTAAVWQELCAQARKNGNTTLWAIASGLGMLIAGITNVHLLRLLVDPWSYPTLDVIATGLAIGGGTKGLHDLISNLQQKGSS